MRRKFRGDALRTTGKVMAHLNYEYLYAQSRVAPYDLPYYTIKSDLAMKVELVFEREIVAP